MLISVITQCQQLDFPCTMLSAMPLDLWIYGLIVWMRIKERDMNIDYLNRWRMNACIILGHLDWLGLLKDYDTSVVERSSIGYLFQWIRERGYFQLQVGDLI